MEDQRANWINKLNQQAKEYETKGLTSFDAIEQVASDFDLQILSEGDACRVYQTPDGMLVNCWVDENDRPGAKPMDVKFDNNIAWFTKKS